MLIFKRVLRILTDPEMFDISRAAKSDRAQFAQRSANERDL